MSDIKVRQSCCLQNKSLHDFSASLLTLVTKELKAWMCKLYLSLTPSTCCTVTSTKLCIHKQCICVVRP